MIAYIGDIQFVDGENGEVAHVHDHIRYTFTDLQQFELWAGENALDYVIPDVYKGEVIVHKVGIDATNH